MLTFHYLFIQYIFTEGLIYTQCWLAAAAKSLQSCLTLCDPIDGSSPSLGFSRQEHWSGLPFPSPMLESEKWKWSRSVMSDPQRPHGLQPTRLLRPWDFPGRRTGVGCHDGTGAKLVLAWVLGKQRWLWYLWSQSSLSLKFTWQDEWVMRRWAQSSENS